uniref:Uncharacterized protein n=1 Tax=Rhizophora mucronata TaxID=61149 RepID=A0A2P2IJX8_RHIMU
MGLEMLWCSSLFVFRNARLILPLVCLV